MVIVECQPDAFHGNNEDLDKVIYKEIVSAKEGMSYFFMSKCGVGTKARGVWV